MKLTFIELPPFERYRKEHISDKEQFTIILLMVIRFGFLPLMEKAKKRI